MTTNFEEPLVFLGKPWVRVFYAGESFVVVVAVVVPTELDTEMAEAIEELLDELSKAATLEVTTKGGNYDEVLGTEDAESTVSYTVTITPPVKFKRAYILDNPVKSSDTRVYVASQELLALGVNFADLYDDPDKRITFIIDSIRMGAIAMKTIMTGQLVGLYEVAVRGHGTLVPSTTSTDIDVELREAVEELLDEVGRGATYIIQEPATYNEITGVEIDGPGPTEYTVKCTPPSPFAENRIDGTDILRGDIRTFIQAKDLPFQPIVEHHTLELDGELLRVTMVGAGYSGEQVAIWELGLRK